MHRSEGSKCGNRCQASHGTSILRIFLYGCSWVCDRLGEKRRLGRDVAKSCKASPTSRVRSTGLLGQVLTSKRSQFVHGLGTLNNVTERRSRAAVFLDLA